MNPACRSSVALAALGGMLLLSACSGGTDAPLNRGIAEIDAVFAEYDRRGFPGCGLAVMKNGELLYSRGYGFANLDYDVPITADTIFDVASINKQFVGAAISMLALDGKLSLDDDVRTWLPEIPDYGAPVTLRHMLSHTSGFRDYLNLFPLAGHTDYYPLSLEQIVDMMSRQRALAFPPGERYQYSNTSYMLLAKVIERASGQTLAEFADERLFAPAGMQASLMYDNYEEVIPQRSIGYHIDDDGTVRMVHNFNFDIPGDGQLYATMEDLLRWDDYLHGADRPPIYELMMTEGQTSDGAPLGYTLGLEFYEYRGLRAIGHTGGSWGFDSQYIRFTDHGLSIAVACNDEYAPADQFARRVADYFLADYLEPPEQKRPDPYRDTMPEAPLRPGLNKQQLQDYAGDYFSEELDATYRFRVVDADLQLTIGKLPPRLVLPAAVDRFDVGTDLQRTSYTSGIVVQFDRNRAGDIVGFGLDSGTEVGIVFEKIR